MKQPLISVEELRNRLKSPTDAPNTVVLDCRFSLADTELGEEQYRQGHIPGAYYCHLDRDLSGDKVTHGGRHPLPNPIKAASKFRSAGINPDSLVVVYDDSRFGFASRAWWLLRYLGHEQVRVLEGGFRAWSEAKLPIDRRAPGDKQGKFTPDVQSDWIVNVKQVQQFSANQSALLIDSREPRRYQGLEEPIDPIAGHIPGALNYPWQDVSTPNGYAVSTAEHIARWQTLPPHIEEDLVIYCGSGVTACVNLLSLALAGKQARLYPGSWSDWCSYEDTIKATSNREAVD